MIFNKENFKEHRKKLRWTTKALSEASNISRESISKWENGQREPSTKSVYKLAKTLGIRVSEISDLEDLYPKSESKVSETIITDNTNLLDTINTEEDISLNNILVNLKSMNNNLKRVSRVLKTILLNVNNILYIKDNDQKYVLVSKAFLDNCSLNVEFVSKGKKDEDFFSKNEADFNSNEDKQIIETGNPVINTERYIPGSRRQKWGIFNKIPILDNNQKIKGVICVIIDITDRKKEEKYSKILEYAISQSKTAIWVGKGIDFSNTPRLSKEVVYWKRSENSVFWEGTDADNITDKEITENWYKAVSKKTKKKFIQEKKKVKYPKTRYYYVTSPYNGSRIWIKERIFFDKENEAFVGLITEDSDSLQLNLLSNIINSMSDIIVWSGYIDSENKFNYTYLNNTSEITGYSSENFINDKISFSGLAIESHKKLFQHLNEQTSYPFSFEFKINDINGKQRWLKGTFFKENKFDDSELTVYFGYYVDVSEGKYLEESLRELKFKELGIEN